VKLRVLASISVFIVSAIGLKHLLPILIWKITPSDMSVVDEHAFVAAITAAIWFKPFAYGLAALITGFVFARLIQMQSLLEAAVFGVVVALLCGVEGVGLLESTLIGGTVLGLFILGAFASRMTAPNHSMQGRRP